MSESKDDPSVPENNHDTGLPKEILEDMIDIGPIKIDGFEDVVAGILANQRWAARSMQSRVPMGPSEPLVGPNDFKKSK